MISRCRCIGNFVTYRHFIFQEILHLVQLDFVTIKYEFYTNFSSNLILGQMIQENYKDPTSWFWQIIQIEVCPDKYWWPTVLIWRLGVHLWNLLNKRIANIKGFAVIVYTCTCTHNILNKYITYNSSNYPNKDTSQSF